MALVIMLMFSCDMNYGDKSNVQVEYIQILDEKIINGDRCVVFYDTKTDSRILYYSGAMVILPKENK